MNRRLIAGTMVAAMIMASGAAFAAPVASGHSPASPFFSHDKTVSFSLRNGSAAPITVKAGDKEITLAAGQTVPVKLPVGTRVVAVNATSTQEAGAVLVEVASSLSDATIVLK